MPKISDLNVADALTGAETLPVVQSGNTKRTTTQEIADLVDLSGKADAADLTTLEGVVDGKLDATDYVKGAGTFCSGKPSNNEVIGGWVMQEAGTFTTANCAGKALVAATASTTVTIKLNGSSIGTAVWAASGTTATMTITSSPQAYSAGDHVTWHAPATADATLADITITLR